LYRTLSTLDVFVDKSLDTPRESRILSGFNYNRELIYAAVANTYLETIGNKADSLHRRIKMRSVEDITTEYVETVRVVGRRVDLHERDVVLAFDYTDEDYYGKLETFWLYGWTGVHAVTGKFKFLTCALVCTTAPIRVPLVSIPVHLGHDMADAVLYCLDFVQTLVRSVQLVLFDRGFYSKDLMMCLSDDGCKWPYLIFVPKNSKVKRELAAMEDQQRKVINHNFKVNRNKTTKHGKTTLAFLKQVYDKKANRNFDWSFATNMNEVDLDTIIQTYKKRWRIETMFRVQDEARILSKSKDIRIRFFYFAYAQVLQLLWAAIFKEKVGFKEFLIILNETAKEREEKAERKRKHRAGSVST